MKLLLTIGGGLGDIMSLTLKHDLFGRIQTLINEKKEVYLVCWGNNIFDVEWFNWIDDLNVFRVVPPKEYATSKSISDWIKDYCVDLKEYIPIDLNNETNILYTKYKPSPIILPTFDHIPKEGIFVQPFAGTSNRSLFSTKMIEALDREKIYFVGRNKNRIFFYGDPKHLRFKDSGTEVDETLPPLKYATNYIDKLSVMETFDLLKKSTWYVGVNSSFLLPARIMKKNILAVVPKVVIEDQSYTNNEYSSLLSIPYTDSRHTQQRILMKEKLTDESFINIFDEMIGNFL